MGRVIRREVVALRCERRSCAALHPLPALSIYADWSQQQTQLLGAIEVGWVLVLTPQLRSYCPEHAQSAVCCTCRTNPDRTHLCVYHDAQAAALLWEDPAKCPLSDAGAPQVPTLREGDTAASVLRSAARVSGADSVRGSVGARNAAALLGAIGTQDIAAEQGREAA